MLDERGFVAVDALGALDTAERLSALPADALVRGMILNRLREHFEMTGGKAEPFDGFRQYSVAELLKLLEEGVKASDLSPAETLRRAGHVIFPMFRQTLVGRVIVALDRNSFEGLLSVVDRAYKAISEHGHISMRREGRSAIVELRNAWAFPAYIGGVAEGAVRHYHPHGRVRVRANDLSSLDIRFDW